MDVVESMMSVSAILPRLRLHLRAYCMTDPRYTAARPPAGLDSFDLDSFDLDSALAPHYEAS